MNDLRTAAQQALEAMRRAVPTGKITLYEWDRAISDLSAALAQQAEPVEPVSNEALRLAGLALIGLAEHDQHCDVFDLDDQGRHKVCTCGLNDAIAVITQAGKSAPPQRKPLTDEEIERICMTYQSPRQAARAIERAHGITDPQVADHLARHGIPMPEGNPK